MLRRTAFGKVSSSMPRRHTSGPFTELPLEKPASGTFLTRVAIPPVLDRDIVEATLDFRLYATKRGERPLIRAAGGVCHSTPQWRRTLSL